MSSPSSFTIEELTGDGNILVLQGRALPYRPMSFDGSMRAEFTWYPGNPVGTVQMLGAKEEPTTVNGMWKDRFLKGFTDLGTPVLFGQTGSAQLNGLTLGDVASIVREVDKFRRRGQLLRVTWDEITRQGILTKFRQTWLRREDVEWEMEFTWIAQQDPIQPTSFAVSIPAVDLANQILAGLQDLLDAIDEIKSSFATVTSVINAVNTAIDDIEQAATELGNIAKQVSNLVTAPFDAVRRMVAALVTVQDQAESIITTFNSIPDRIKRIQADTSNQSDTLDAADLFRNGRAKARDLRGLAARRALELAAQSTTQAPLATVVAREGQDLRDISFQFYGTTAQWRNLASYNNLSASRLSAGVIVVVPKLSTAGV